MPKGKQYSYLLIVGVVNVALEYTITVSAQVTAAAIVPEGLKEMMMMIDQCKTSGNLDSSTA